MADPLLEALRARAAGRRCEADGAFYNEHDPRAVAWLRELSTRGYISQGEVDARNIQQLTAGDLRGHRRAHFFAGIGVWDYALRCAGWPEDEEVWTGSCPCQPFSVAGRGRGTSDERHLWPVFRRLISECRPASVFGEQVASAAGRAWLDAVRVDLEALGYAVGAADLCAAGVGAPHIRQRLYWYARRLADDADERLDGRRAGEAGDGRDAARLQPQRLRDARGLAHHHHHGREVERGEGLPAERHAPRGDDVDGRCEVGRLGDSNGRGGRDSSSSATEAPGEREGLQPRGVGDVPRAPGAARGVGESQGDGRGQAGRNAACGVAPHGDEARDRDRDAGATRGFWGDVEWLPCRDGKWRPVEPGTFPLAHGAPARVGRLRGYGNALVAPLAVEFIKAVMEAGLP